MGDRQIGYGANDPGTCVGLEVAADTDVDSLLALLPESKERGGFFSPMVSPCK